MSGDVKWIVGTGIGIMGTIIGTGLVLAGLMSAQLGSVSAEIAAVNTRIDDLIARTSRRDPSVWMTACARTRCQAGSASPRRAPQWLGPGTALRAESTQRLARPPAHRSFRTRHCQAGLSSASGATGVERDRNGRWRSSEGNIRLRSGSSAPVRVAASTHSHDQPLRCRTNGLVLAGLMSAQLGSVSAKSRPLTRGIRRSDRATGPLSTGNRTVRDRLRLRTREYHPHPAQARAAVGLNSSLGLSVDPSRS